MNIKPLAILRAYLYAVLVGIVLTVCVYGFAALSQQVKVTLLTAVPAVVAAALVVCTSRLTHRAMQRARRQAVLDARMLRRARLDEFSLNVSSATLEPFKKELLQRELLLIRENLKHKEQAPPSFAMGMLCMLPRSVREGVAGDLTERYELLLSEAGCSKSLADLWFLSQAIQASTCMFASKSVLDQCPVPNNKTLTEEWSAGTTVTLEAVRLGRQPASAQKTKVP